MAKISENRIPDINADWGLDVENGLPYSGEAVQEFIKDTFKNKFGYFYYDENNNRYLVFADETSKDLYLNDPELNKDLLLTTFDAPFNYSARVEMITPAYNAVLIGTTGNNLQFKFAIEDKSGNNTGENVDCSITIINSGVKKSINKVYTSQQGINGVLIELDDYLKEGTNTISITIKGLNTLAATTVSIVYQIVNLKFTDNFNISKVYNNGDLLEVSCVVEGAGTKVIDWYLDGVQLPYELTDEIPYITAYTVNKSILLKDLVPGVHSLQYRLRSQVGDTWFKSQTLFRNFFVSGVNETVIGVASEIPVGVEPIKSNVLDRLYGMIQYVPYNIRYAIYNPNDSATNTVEIYLNNELQLTTNITNGVENISSIMCSEFGNIPVKITVNGKNYELNSDTAISSIGVSEIADAVINLRAFGRDNNAIDKETWTYGDYSTTFNGLYWNVQSGWVENTLILNANASASINYIPFEKDPMTTGKTIEIEFATRNVINNDSVILDLTNDNEHGLLITASEAKLTTSDNKRISTKFKAEENNRISFVINRRESGNNAGFIFIYVNGILSGAAEYDTTATINVQKNIVFKGSSDVLLKQIVVYDKPLSSDEILNNYILYRDSISEMLSIYNRNNVTTEDGQLSPEKLVNTLPVMYFTGLDENRGIPYLETQTGKDATKIDTYFDIEYQNAQDKTKNFKLEYARVRIQGTSSSYYPRKNYRFYSNKEDETVLYDWQGNVVPDRQYSFKDGAQPVDCWCLKTDYAESSGSHNTGVARLWNKVMKNAVIDGENKLMTTAQKVAAESGYPYDVRTTVDGFPIVVFYRNSYNHPWQFLGKFNFNNDKSTPSVFGFCDIPGFDNSRMQCWEVLNNGHALCNFTKFDSDYFDQNWEDAFEARYDEDNPLIEDLKAFSAWIYSTKGNVEKFKTEKWDHLDVYKMAAYYVYIMRFGAVDQTVKNSMFTSEDGEHFFFINYDNDTIFGVRNDGLLKHNPYIDRQSIDPEKANTDNPYVYAGHDSVLWNNLEADEEFMEIVKSVDSSLYEAGLTYDAIINMFENEQTSKWCERVCNTDAHYKYIAPPSGRVIESLQGNRNSHRRWWVSERFNLYDAKFVTGDFKNYVVELKIVGEEIPFATITAAKRQPYGYEILNSASEVTDILDIDEEYSFTSPKNQTLQDGDPISIYSACNLKALDLSGCMHCALKIDLSRINSPSVGNSLKKLVMHGDNYALDDATFTGTEVLTKLEYLDIQGMHALGSINLSNSLNLKTLLAKNTGLTSVKLAPGCLIERLELPTSTAAIVLEDLPLLDSNNLILEGDWAQVRQVKISGCPNITNNFDLILNWYKNSNHINTRSLDITGVNWTNVNIDDLISIVSNVNVNIKGKIKLQYVRQEDKRKLLTLKNVLRNDNIYNRDSDLYIYGPDEVYIFGPESGYILEGDNYRIETILFSENEGFFRFANASTDGTWRDGVVLNEETGDITTIETGEETTTLFLRGLYFISATELLNSDTTIIIKKRTYPENVSIVGPSSMSEENETVYKYSWTSPTVGIDGKYNVEWSLKGDVLNYVQVLNRTFNEITIERKSIPDTLAMGTLTLFITKQYDNSEVAIVTMNVNVSNPDIIMTSETNPEVMQVLYNAGISKNEHYLLKSEAAAITNEDLYPKVNDSIFENAKIKHFEEFKYFTGVTTIGSYAFSECSNLTKISLPRSIVTIESYAFANTSLASIHIPVNVNYISQSCFDKSDELVNISIELGNVTYIAENNCIYTNAGSTLYIIAPGLTEYIMRDETQKLQDPDSIFRYASKLKKITINSTIDFEGRWFMYGLPDLIEVTGPENHPICSFVDGCVFNKDVTELLYCPSGKNYTLEDLPETVTVLGKYAFVQNRHLSSFIVPDRITNIGTWCCYRTPITKVVIPTNCSLTGDNNFGQCDSLVDVDLRTTNISATAIFDSCDILENVTLPNGLTQIPKGMFGNCKNLKSVIIPESVTSIGNETFYNCTSLPMITIPKNVTSIGNSAFTYDTQLGVIICLPKMAPTLGASVFSGTKGSPPVTYYVGADAENRVLHLDPSATGYDSGDWKDVLQDLAGFTISPI